MKENNLLEETKVRAIRELSKDIEYGNISNLQNKLYTMVQSIPKNNNIYEMMESILDDLKKCNNTNYKNILNMCIDDLCEINDVVYYSSSPCVVRNFISFNYDTNSMDELLNKYVK